jgi:glycosyltransferase involved in cell wall biosynthesis
VDQEARLMTKVLHIHTLPVISGSGLNTFLTMEGLKKRGYETALACAPGGKLNSLVSGRGMRVIPFKNLVQPLHPLKDSLVVLDLARFLKTHPYHIVHTHNSKAGFVGRLAAKLAGVPAVVHTVHGFSFHDQEPPWRQGLFRSMERLAAQWCDQLIFISQPLMAWALREGIGKKEKMTRIYSGIELDRFQPVSEEKKMDLRRKWGLGEQDAVVGIVSKLWDGKGHIQLLDAFRQIHRTKKEAKLVIVGEGYRLEDLRRLVDTHGLDGSVLFAGFQADVAPLVATFDAAVLPSLFEGMGRVLLEAMAMGKPVVASRIGGIPDLVEHGVNGYLVRPGSVKDLKEALLKILNNPSLARKMGQAGRQRIKSEFDALAMVDAIERVYRHLLSRKGVAVGP